MNSWIVERGVKRLDYSDYDGSGPYEILDVRQSQVSSLKFETIAEGDASRPY